MRNWQRFGRMAVAGALSFASAAAWGFETEQPVVAPEPDPVITERSIPASGAVAYGAVTGVPVQYYGEYRVGHIKKPWLAHIFQYSSYNPYIDQLHQPFREVIYGDRHARYYTAYHAYTPISWDTTYYPATGYCQPGHIQPVTELDPNARAPYGPASATYFGAYGYGQ